MADVGGGKPEVILMANGSEVSLIVDAAQTLANEGVATRIVSFPSWDLFEKQPVSYQHEVLPPEIKPRLAVEAAVAFGWKKWVGDDGDVLSVDHYGASAPAARIFSEFGFTVENIVNRVKILLGKG